MSKPKIDLIITSFNGQRLLEKHLPAVINNSPEANQIYVYDDAGSDDSADFLKENYPQIIYVKNKKNLGFTQNTNLAVANSKADYICLLNNDVSPKKNYLTNALKYFRFYPQLFAVSLAEQENSWPLVSWRNGKFHFEQAKKRSRPHFSLWASGGSCFVKRSVWQRLGGFNPIYSPGYWEDIDLGLRAWKMGFQIIWSPYAQVDHQHESTFSIFKPSYLNNLKQRNELLFHWQNLTEINLILSHKLFLLTHTLKHLGYTKVILSAISKVFQIKRLGKTKYSESQVLNLVNRPL